MELNECISNLEKINRIRIIRKTLSTIESYVSTIEDKFSDEDECETIIEDKDVAKIIKQVKYDLETLERYL